MRLCERCGQRASLRIAEGGVEHWTCSPCSNVVGGGDGLPRLADLLIRPRRRNGICPNCSANQQDAIESGLVGCPLCYSAFDDDFWTTIGVPKGQWSRSDTH